MHPDARSFGNRLDDRIRAERREGRRASFRAVRTANYTPRRRDQSGRNKTFLRRHLVHGQAAGFGPGSHVHDPHLVELPLKAAVLAIGSVQGDERHIEVQVAQPGDAIRPQVHFLNRESRVAQAASHFAARHQRHLALRTDAAHQHGQTHIRRIARRNIGQKRRSPRRTRLRCHVHTSSSSSRNVSVRSYTLLRISSIRSRTSLAVQSLPATM